MGVSVRHGADPCEGQERLQAAVGAQLDVCVETISHHQATLAFNAKLGGHAVKHVVVGFAYCVSLALGRCLHRLQQAARTWEEERGS